MFSSITYNRFKTGSLILFCGIMALSCSTGVDAATLQFKPQVMVSAEVIRLGDVAEVYDYNPEVQERLQQIVLRPAPAGGIKIRMSVDEIRSRLKASGVNMLAVELRGSTHIEIMTGQATGLIQQVAHQVPDSSMQERKLEFAVKALKQSIQQYLQLSR
ncbi:MAG: hypothetical protein R3C11_15240 [Planctomycetaceae bacterium]